ncbi:MULTISPECIES: hypothetical protein [Clavibacter]|uniref:hypothetical protein n=1 Tax=Clavibacter TaxID=1573 RepID=UPI000A9ADE45|nr:MULTISPECIES: hypothetical protein [Clavibacter]MDA3804016.1 hypothetical protein [Clavibacter sp. CT19]
MAITNLPYDDDRILEAVAEAHVLSRETRDVRVDFTGTGVSEEDTATVTATLTWTVTAAEAVRILDVARVQAGDEAGAADGPSAILAACDETS